MQSYSRYFHIQTVLIEQNQKLQVLELTSFSFLFFYFIFYLFIYFFKKQSFGHRLKSVYNRVRFYRVLEELFGEIFLYDQGAATPC